MSGATRRREQMPVVGGDATAVSILAKLVSWWPHDETSGSAFADVHGGHDGTYFNSPTLAAGGVTFNGSNQYGTVADGAWAYLSDFSAGFRVKYSTGQDRRYILNNWTGSAGFAVTTDTGTSGSTRGLIYNTATRDIHNSTSINDNVERIVMLTRVGSVLTLSVSGTADVTSGVTTTVLGDSSNPMTFGRNAAGGDYFGGRIAHSFFGGPLDATERAFIINSGAFLTYADIVAAAS